MPGPFVIVWRYGVKFEHRAAFEAAYGPAGDWARLFACAPGYAGTELLRDAGGFYLTIDRWSSMQAFESFFGSSSDQYSALDTRCAEWTLSEERIGQFEVVAAPFAE